ncbi:hypothetical protein HDU87_000777 [Geranomyces variabilis]|uniref:Uncharacterized protein n=1 Tax=Geranomyces variabilis TaxID=109894 RepID=A0AAD5XP90_9FUNG|nr:hypothetical protein HDU87_000777 [Geranomyces variabilis]
MSKDRSRSPHKHLRGALSPDMFATAAAPINVERLSAANYKMSATASPAHSSVPPAPTPADTNSNDALGDADDSSFSSVTDETMQTLRSLAHFPPDPSLLASPRNPLSPPGSSQKKKKKPDDDFEEADSCAARSLVELVLEDPAALLEQKKKEWEQARVYLVDTLAKLADAAHNYERPRLLASKQAEFKSRTALLSAKDAEVEAERERLSALLDRETALIARYTNELEVIKENARKLRSVAPPPAVATPQTRLPGTELNAQALVAPLLAVIAALIFTIVTDAYQRNRGYV